MLWSTLLLSAIVFTARILTAPSIHALVPREAVATNRTPAINATVVDRAGHDITSSFQIRFYNPRASMTTTNNNSLSNRQVVSSRPINGCSSGSFHESFCTPEDNKTGSLQSYTIICHVVVPLLDAAGAPISRFVPIQTVASRTRDGHCEDHEICVPGLGAGRSRSGRRMASCVRTEYFVNYISWGDHRQQGLHLGGTQASVVVSQPDETTPMEVAAFRVDAETTSMSSVQKNTCRDCLELETDQFRPRTEGLKVQTTLLTTGAMAGVLWLAIISG